MIFILLSMVYGSSSILFPNFVCTEKYIGTNAFTDLLSILKKEKSENVFTDPKLYFNPLRKIVDDLFIAFNKHELLPDVFVKPTVSLNESSKFLSGGIEKGYQTEVIIFPKIISNNVRNILSVCQPASHRAEIDAFIAQVHSPYLLLSITYQLLDVLLWFKYYVDNNNDVEFNKAKYRRVENIINTSVKTGIVEQDDNLNYHCGEIILTYRHVKDMEYIIGDEIRILRFAINTNEKTMHLYANSAIQSEKLT